MTQKYYDLIEDKEFEALDISKPGKLETEDDERLALQYIISTFRMSINAIRKMYGYEARQKTLYVISKFLGHARMTHIPVDDLEGQIAMLLLDCVNMADGQQAG